ncbi:MAG: hypothetical protein PHE33_01115 [Bacteroidales bacterium]|nr:hypothetical protein [Bacteroidales bacterium]
MKKIILISIAFALSLCYISCGQSNNSNQQTSETKDSNADIEDIEYSVDITPSENENYNPYFDIVNIDESGKITSVKPTKQIKVNHEELYKVLFAYDFDKNGELEEIFSSFDAEGYARFSIKPDGTMYVINIYDELSDIPTDDEGFWFYIADIFGDSNPEILIYSKIGEKCFVQISNYSTVKQSFVGHNYELNSLSLSKHLLIKNENKIIIPFGSQGLFEEAPLIIE